MIFYKNPALIILKLHYQNLSIMKSIFRAALFFGLAILLLRPVFSQVTDKPIEKSNKMDNINNKEIIQSLYYLLNKKQFEKLSEIISVDYINPLGGKGVEGFQKSLLELAKAFPDAHWKAEEILADGNKVVVKQKFTGTQTNQFQNFKPTNKNVSVDGITTFELQNGKIIHSQVLTDRLGFLQQLGVLPIDLSTLTNKK
jgi:predicted ester cyclase